MALDLSSFGSLVLVPFSAQNALVENWKQTYDNDFTLKYAGSLFGLTDLSSI
jgi:hypothetical protein